MLKFRKLILIFFIPLSGILSEKIDNSQCTASTKLDDQCGRYCYRIVKPLLQYASSIRSKEDQFTALNNKILNLEATIKLQENQLKSYTSHEKYCLTKNDLLDKSLVGVLVDQIKLLITSNNNIENQLKTELVNKDSQISNLKSQELAKAEKIRELKNKLTEKEEEIETDKNNENQLKMELKNKDSEISNLKSQKVAMTEKIRELQNKLTEKEKEIDINKNNEIQLKSDLKYKDSEILNLKNVANVERVRELESTLTEKEIEKCLSSCIGKQTGIYQIKVSGSNPFNVSCDSMLFESGWTVIQRRRDGSENFNRGMKDYRLGFGKLNGEFFVGLDKLHLMTNSRKHELFIYMKKFNNEGYARYSHFLIGGEEEHFKLKSLGNYSGNAGDAMDSTLNMKFSTPDEDHDNWSGASCAKLYESGWWFKDCGNSMLNGKYQSVENAKSDCGIQWQTWTFESLEYVQMMIRPIE